MMRWVLLFVFAAGTFAWGQPPRGFYPWWDRPIAKDLKLSEAQSTQIRTTIREFRGKLIETRAAVQKAELELENAFEEENVDARRANQAIEDLAKARENLTRTFSQMALQLRLVLTPEQWRELQKRRGGEGGPRRMNRGGGRQQMR
jgi:Spy/CpxP family protein refolding chaperone